MNNYPSFQAEKHYLLFTFQSTSYWETPDWPKAFLVLLYKQRITAHIVTALVAFYACAIIVRAHFRDFSERPVVIMLRETLGLYIITLILTSSYSFNIPFSSLLFSSSSHHLNSDCNPLFLLYMSWQRKENAEEHRVSNITIITGAYNRAHIIIWEIFI